MADRMQRIWAQGSTLSMNTLTLGSQAEVQLFPSATLEAATDRSIRDFTVTRILGNLQFTTQDQTTFFYGIRLAQEAEPVGTYSPGTDQAIDWMYWGAVVVQYPTLGNGTQWFTEKVDNRSQRKSRGMDSGLRLYVYNGAGSTGYYMWSGRTLALV